jgi:hypothetical protein
MTGLRAFAIASVLLVVATPAAAQKWTVLEEESVSLALLNAKGQHQLAISCASQQSDIVVPVEPGVSKPTKAPMLVMQLPKGEERLTLQPELCGKGECSDHSEGDVYVYIVRQKGKDLPLKAATASRFVFDAPGAKIAADADTDTSRRFQ